MKAIKHPLVVGKLYQALCDLEMYHGAYALNPVRKGDYVVALGCERTDDYWWKLTLLTPSGDVSSATYIAVHRLLKAAR